MCLHPGSLPQLPSPSPRLLVLLLFLVASPTPLRTSLGEYFHDTHVFVHLRLRVCLRKPDQSRLSAVCQKLSDGHRKACGLVFALPGLIFWGNHMAQRPLSANNRATSGCSPGWEKLTQALHFPASTALPLKAARGCCFEEDHSI